MNITLNKVLIFTAGAAIGSMVTYVLFDKKLKADYEHKLAEDTASIKEAFADVRGCELTEEEKEEVISSIFPKETDPYSSVLSRLNYVEDSRPEEVETEKKDDSMEDVERPQVIHPCEYAEYHDYDTQTLYYYTDDVLADDMDNVVENVEDIVGSYALTTFGQYEDDAVHVRNDRKRCYYEILRSECAYSEKYGQNLCRKED